MAQLTDSNLNTDAPSPQNLSVQRPLLFRRLNDHPGINATERFRSNRLFRQSFRLHGNIFQLLTVEERLLSYDSYVLSYRQLTQLLLIFKRIISDSCYFKTLSGGRRKNLCRDIHRLLRGSRRTDHLYLPLCGPGVGYPVTKSAGHHYITDTILCRCLRCLIAGLTGSRSAATWLWRCSAASRLRRRTRL